MTSPFASFANASLRFQVASGNLEPDSKGNLRPGVAIVEVSALLEQARRPDRESRPGVDSEGAYYLEGFAVAPMQLPAIITASNRCAASWAGKQGEFFIEPVARSPWQYERVTGDELRGWFIQSSFTVEGEPYQPGMISNQINTNLNAAIALSALRLVALDDAGQVVYASSDNPDQAHRVLGLLLNAVQAGEQARILTDGSYTDLSWNWTPGSPLFLGVNGELTQTPQQAAGFILRCGTVASPTQIDFELQEPILL